MSERAAVDRLDGVRRPSPLSLPVMFFGTLEIAWMPQAEIMSWGDGVKAKLDQKAKSRRHFTKSVQQVGTVPANISITGRKAATDCSYPQYCKEECHAM